MAFVALEKLRSVGAAAEALEHAAVAVLRIAFFRSMGIDHHTGGRRRLVVGGIVEVLAPFGTVAGQVEHFCWRRTGRMGIDHDEPDPGWADPTVATCQSH